MTTYTIDICRVVAILDTGIAGNNYYGNYHVVGVWLKGDRDTLEGYKLYTNRIEAELVCNHLITD